MKMKTILILSQVELKSAADGFITVFLRKSEK
jgi:hypothetical protein